jgi:hypothetical protein
MEEEKKDSKIEEAVAKNNSVGSKKVSKMSFFKYFSRLIFVLVTAVAVYSSYQLYILKKPNYQQEMAQKQTQKIITAVSDLIEIPTDTPQVATVADVDTLKKTQPFFEKAQNGDQVLVFQNEAILYRPTANKIINVAAVTRNTAPAVTTPATATTGDTTKATETKTPEVKAPVKK